MSIIRGLDQVAASASIPTQANLNSANSRVRQYVSAALNVNQTNTDLLSITLPSAKCLVTKVEVFAGTGTPALATVDVRTATAGGGAAIVSAQALTLLTSAVCVPAVISTSHLVTTSLLVIRVVTAAGFTATAQVMIELIDVS